MQEIWCHTAVPPCLIEAAVRKVRELGQDVKDRLPYKVPDKLQHQYKGASSVMVGLPGTRS